MDQAQNFLRLNPIERFFNRFFGWLVSFGFGLPHNYLLQVRGRKTGKIHSTPVNVLNHNKKLFLVAARGYTQWARNALADQQVTLKKGRVRLKFKLRAGMTEAGYFCAGQATFGDASWKKTSLMSRFPL